MQMKGWGVQRRCGLAANGCTCRCLGSVVQVIGESVSAGVMQDRAELKCESARVRLMGGGRLRLFRTEYRSGVE